MALTGTGTSQAASHTRALLLRNGSLGWDSSKGGRKTCRRTSRSRQQLDGVSGLGNLTLSW